LGAGCELLNIDDTVQAQLRNDLRPSRPDLEPTILRQLDTAMHEEATHSRIRQHLRLTRSIKPSHILLQQEESDHLSFKSTLNNRNSTNPTSHHINVPTRAARLIVQLNTIQSTDHMINNDTIARTSQSKIYLSVSHSFGTFMFGGRSAWEDG